MNFQALINARYSVRAYKPEPVPREKLDRVLEAARLAPTAANRQPFRVIVVEPKGREKELSRIYPRKWFVQAPVLLAVVAVPSEGWVRKYDGWNAAEVDATIVMSHIVLAATEEGLGTCWVGAFDPAAAREVLGLPPEVVPAAFAPLGYPADAAAPKRRRRLAELVRRDRW
ncbi:MAG TPA: nitroreductase family protein [Candidatus Aminicenantes bacterium]|nr:nitroreductase family protein [Candidatus Aminicenantes bacterium]